MRVLKVVKLKKDIERFVECPDCKSGLAVTSGEAVKHLIEGKHYHVFACPVCAKQIRVKTKNWSKLPTVPTNQDY
jgi:uncharacterized protein with PIN domain